MYKDRQTLIEMYSCDGDLTKLHELLGPHPEQSELDSALEMALAYSRILVAKHLLTLGADIQYGDCQGAYYAVHNNELEGIQFAVENGVDVNFGNGMLLVESVITAHNEKDPKILIWLLEHGADISRVSSEGLRTIKTFETPQTIRLLEET